MTKFTILCTTCRNGDRRPVLTCQSCGGLGYFPEARSDFRNSGRPATSTPHVHTEEVLSPPALPAHQTALAPHRRAEFEHERWGWSATLETFARHVAELAQAIEAFQNRDRETPSAYALAGKIRITAWAISADTAQIAALESMIANAAR